MAPASARSEAGDDVGQAGGEEMGHLVDRMGGNLQAYEWKKAVNNNFKNICLSY